MGGVRAPMLGGETQPMLIDLTPFFGYLDTTITGKMHKKACTTTVYIFSHHTIQSLFAKLVQAAIMHQYRNVHPKDSLYE